MSVVHCHMPKFELPDSHHKFTDHEIRVVRANAAVAERPVPSPRPAAVAAEKGEKGEGNLLKRMIATLDRYQQRGSRAQPKSPHQLPPDRAHGAALFRLGRIMPHASGGSKPTRFSVERNGRPP